MISWIVVRIAKAQAIHEATRTRRKRQSPTSMEIQIADEDDVVLPATARDCEQLTVG